MKLFIRVIDGIAFEHPVTEETMQYAFPDIDLNNLPSSWAEFIKTPKPEIGLYQTFENPMSTYEFVDGKFTDVWHFRDMTQEEKAEKQQIAKNNWANDPVSVDLVGWIFDETMCKFIAPIPRPSDDVNQNKYFWQGTTMSWVERPPYPNDGKEYKLDRPTATWVLIN